MQNLYLSVSILHTPTQRTISWQKCERASSVSEHRSNDEMNGLAAWWTLIARERRRVMYRVFKPPLAGHVCLPSFKTNLPIQSAWRNRDPPALSYFPVITWNTRDSTCLHLHKHILGVLCSYIIFHCSIETKLGAHMPLILYTKI